MRHVVSFQCIRTSHKRV